MGNKVKELLKKIYDMESNDGVTFTLSENGNVEFIPFDYKEEGVPVTHELGYKYHLITYRVNGKKIHEPELVEAVLGDPHHYIALLIKLGYYGMICKKKDTSDDFARLMFEDLMNRYNKQQNGIN